MHRSLLMLAGLLVVSVNAGAATKMQMSIVPAAPDCFAGPGFCLNVDGSCVMDNSECALGTVSTKSKVKMKGTLALKAKIKGVTDVTGALMTTGPAETAVDNLVLKIGLSACPVDTGAPPICDDPSNVYLKVVLTGGEANLNIDLAPVFPGLLAGNPFAVLGVTLLGTPGGGNCLGTNSTTDITARLNDSTCEASSIVRGVGGFVLE